MTKHKKIRRRKKECVRFGKNVKRLRILKGWPQEELAVAAGLDRTFISDIENGWRNVSLLNIYKICEALNVEPKELVN